MISGNVSFYQRLWPVLSVEISQLCCSQVAGRSCQLDSRSILGTCSGERTLCTWLRSDLFLQLASRALSTDLVTKSMSSNINVNKIHVVMKRRGRRRKRRRRRRNNNGYFSGCDKNDENSSDNENGTTIL